MDDRTFGTRDASGHWSPNKTLAIAPFYQWPLNIGALARWLPGYFLPWNVLFMLSALVFWWAILPPAETMATLFFGWLLTLFAANFLSILVVYCAFEWRLYVRRAQETRFKFNPEFPEDRPSRFFWFGSQTRDNMARTLLFGVPIWTAWQVAILWAFANGFGASPAQSLGWLIVWGLLVPAVHELHFYCVHRLIHTPWLYKWVHAVHHRSVNPSPWSSLSMHPVEHLLYFSGALIHLVVPSHPLIALYHLHYAGFGAIGGHVGFDRIELGEHRAVDPHAYGHYLHHKHFEVNYGDGLVPLDKLFGTWHDGSPEAAARMRERLVAAKRKARAKRR